MAFFVNENSCDSIFDSSLDVFSFMEDDTAKIAVNVPVVTIPSPKKRKSRNNEPRTGSGRKPLTEKFPQLVPTIDNFISQHGFAADNRRRSTIGRSCGVTLDQTAEHVTGSVDGLKSLHKSTVHRLTEPPNKKFKASERYQGKVHAKVPRKRNDCRKEEPDAQYYAARVKYRVELGSKYAGSCCMLSCDTMNKVNVGALAVSRYHQNSKFFPTNDSPNLPDHDFPTAVGNKISPVGYMFLEKDPSKQSIHQDQFGREHYVFPRSGESFVVNRVQKYHPLTIQSHVNDLLPLLTQKVQEGKTVAILIVDGGPDWNSRSWAVLLYLARLFRDSNLDLLCCTSYAPGQSAFNPIEHLWAPLSKKLTGVILPDHLNGELPPCKQTDLSDKDRTTKDQDVLDLALGVLNGYWDGHLFNGHRINSNSQLCREEDAPYRDYHNGVGELLKKQSKIQEKGQIFSELKFAMEHGDRRNGEFTVMKCTRETCVHCSSKQPSGEAAEILNDIRLHGGMPSPSISSSHPGHYKTFVEAMKSQFVLPDTGMQRFESRKLGRCKRCRWYVFLSEVDAVKHMAVFHDIKPSVTKTRLARRK